MNSPIHLFAFDMNSLFARVFKKHAVNDDPPEYAVPLLDGRHTFCLKPLFNMMLNEIKAVNLLGVFNTHIVIVFDPDGPNFRHSLYDKYKCSRPPKPATWKEQVELSYQMFQAMGYHCLRIKGFEADDVLNTISSKMSSLGIETTIFTGDKDIASCCNEYTQLYLGRKKKILRMADVEGEIGIQADKVLDFLALTGDKVDDVPGVSGIGDKRAKEILSSFDFEQVVNTPEVLRELSFRGVGSVIKSLKEEKDMALLSRKLVELKDDVPLGSNLKQMIRRPPDYSFLDGFMRPKIY